MAHEQLPVVSLHRADGRSVVLGHPRDDVPVALTFGVEGLGAGPVSFATSPRLAGHGSVLRGVRVDERELFLPVLLRGATASEVADTRESLTRFLSPLDASMLTLRVAAPGRDTWREITVRYAGGLEGKFSEGYRGVWHRLGLEFKSVDALWRGEPVPIEKQVDAAHKPFLSQTVGFFPVVLADSTVAGRISVDIAGDAPTPPVWYITPPGEDLLIRNVRTGARFYLSGLLTQQIVVDMEAGRVYEAATGENLNHRTSMDTRFFELAPGRQEIEFSMIGATSASKLELVYSPRYLAGY
ncbi:phage distal tail protein [Kocuria rosea]|uniref:phage distal tail protein n=1 Tax=Kocuria rosea TaxID=1275 RepID=UPI003D35694C